MRPPILKGRSFALAVINAARLHIPIGQDWTVVIHPNDFPFVEKWGSEWFHADTTQTHSQLKGIFYVQERYPPPTLLCTSPKCPRGHVFIIRSKWEARTAAISRTNLYLTRLMVAIRDRTVYSEVQSKWYWPELDKIASQWPDVDPELAKHIYPHPPQSKPLTDAQRHLLVAGVDQPALAHWRSVALRQMVEEGCVEPLPDRGKGWYRTTGKGQRRVRTGKLCWTRIIEDDLG